jgi:hypothetical protein
MKEMQSSSKTLEYSKRQDGVRGWEEMCTERWKYKLKVHNEGKSRFRSSKKKE